MAVTFGTRSDDFLFGTIFADVILDPGGDNAVVAGPGTDLVIAGPGSDLILAGDGDDLIFADSLPFDFLGGNEVLVGGACGTDGSDADTFVIEGTDAGDDTILDFVRAVDRLELLDVHGPDGTLVDDFADLDTNGDQRPDGADAAVTVPDDALILSLTGGSVRLLGITELAAGDVDILIIA